MTRPVRRGQVLRLSVVSEAITAGGQNFNDVARQHNPTRRNYLMELSEISVGDELMLETTRGGAGSSRQGGPTLCLRHQLRAGLCGGRCPTAVPARIASEG